MGATASAVGASFPGDRMFCDDTFTMLHHWFYKGELCVNERHLD